MAVARTIAYLLFAGQLLRATEATGEGSTEQSFCCLAAPDKSDFCGSCFPMAKAAADSKCGQSQSGCLSCGGQAKWCEAGGKDSVVVLVSDSGAAGTADSGDARCSATGEDCASSQCCADSRKRCYRKNDKWASCLDTCVPGVNQHDDVDHRTPWECSVLGHDSKTSRKPQREIVIMLKEPPTINLDEGVEVTVELGPTPEDSLQSPPAASHGSRLAPLLWLEGLATAVAILMALWWRAESQKKVEALDRLKAAVGTSSREMTPPFSLGTPTALERGWAGLKSVADAFSPPRNPTRGPPSPAPPQLESPPAGGRGRSKASSLSIGSTPVRGPFGQV